MNRRDLYLLLQPDNPHTAARIFRLLHHATVGIGVATMLATTVRAGADEYPPLVDAGFYVVAAFFMLEYLVRLFVAPELPGGEHRGKYNARLAWALSVGGVFDLVAAMPGLIALVHVPEAGLFGFVWAFKYV